MKFKIIMDVEIKDDQAYIQTHTDPAGIPPDEVMFYMGLALETLENPGPRLTLVE